MGNENGQKLPKKSGLGELYVVATPLGNLSDLTDRAREALARADAVLCEDTRQTLKLMHHLGLQKPLERLDQHSTQGRIRQVADDLEGGRVLALVSDAGTPAISDPGAALVAECHRRGVRVVPVPGPSAVSTLMSVAGFERVGFSFLGFAPREPKDREEQLQRLKAFPEVRCWVWFESPHRVAGFLSYLAGGVPHSRAVAAKELTKLHEKIYCGSVTEVSMRISEEILSEGERGEWVVAIELADEDLLQKESHEHELRRVLSLLMNAGVSASRAAREVSQSFGEKRNFVYDLALSLEQERKDEGN